MDLFKKFQLQFTFYAMRFEVSGQQTPSAKELLYHANFVLVLTINSYGRLLSSLSLSTTLYFFEPVQDSRSMKPRFRSANLLIIQELYLCVKLLAV